MSASLGERSELTNGGLAVAAKASGLQVVYFNRKSTVFQLDFEKGRKNTF